MNWDAYRDYLLRVLPGAKVASGGSEINCKCMNPNCEDHYRTREGGHMYISIPRDDNSPSQYYCHKCNQGGYVTHTTLISWGIYEADIATSLATHYGILRQNPENRRILDHQAYVISNRYTTEDAKSERKRRYIVERLGYELNFDEMRRLKICLNLYDLLNQNGIKKLTRYRNITDQLEDYFIGFLSNDNAFINMRRTCPEGIVEKSIDKRYVNYKIFNTMDTTQRFYTIPTTIDSNGIEPIKLNISEGPFDILSVYLNLRKQEPGIYVAITGNSYLNVILHFLIEIGIPNMEIHFYPDNDRYGSIERLRKIKSTIPDPYINCYAHFNVFPGEKDFGVPINRIKETVITI